MAAAAATDLNSLSLILSGLYFDLVNESGKNNAVNSSAASNFFLFHFSSPKRTDKI